MEITKVEVVKEDKGRMKGMAKVTLDNCFVIHNIRIIETDNGMILAMPSKGSLYEGYQDICHPINQETRDMFTDKVLEAYNKLGDKE